MKQRIYLYLFVFTALIALYLFVSYSNIIKADQKKINTLENQVVQFKDSLQQEQLRVLNLQYFSLENNDDALAYYDHLNLEDPSRYIADRLLETNESAGDNPLVPYAGMQNNFKINKIKVLNHKWILADFSDGKFWGELLLHYELKDDLSVDFRVLDHLLYTRNN